MKRHLTAIALAATLFASAASAQTYPDRPIKMVVPFAPGGAVDSLARIIGAKMQEALKQPVIVENRPGAGGNIAAVEVMRAPADGYTMLLTTVGHAISPSIAKTLAYDPIKGFTPVTQVISSSLLIVTNPKFPATDLASLLREARQRPGELNYGSTGIGNPLHLTMELLKTSADVSIQMVPFRGDAPLNQALVQGDVQIAVAPLSTARPQVEAGALRAIATTGATRTKAMPQVPTVAEQGFPGFSIDSWQGVFMPANTPRPIVDRIQQEVAKALEDPSVRQRLDGFGSEPVGSTPDAFATFVTAEVAKYAAIIKQAKIPLQD